MFVLRLFVFVCSYAQMLTYYELDLGLNHVTRKWTDETDRFANGLVAGT